MAFNFGDIYLGGNGSKSVQLPIAHFTSEGELIETLFFPPHLGGQFLYNYSVKGCTPGLDGALYLAVSTAHRPFSGGSNTLGNWLVKFNADGSFAGYLVRMENLFSGLGGGQVGLLSVVALVNGNLLVAALFTAGGSVAEFTTSGTLVRFHAAGGTGTVPSANDMTTYVYTAPGETNRVYGDFNTGAAPQLRRLNLVDETAEIVLASQWEGDWDTGQYGWFDATAQTRSLLQRRYTFEVTGEEYFHYRVNLYDADFNPTSTVEVPALLGSGNFSSIPTLPLNHNTYAVLSSDGAELWGGRAYWDQSDPDSANWLSLYDLVRIEKATGDGTVVWTHSTAQLTNDAGSFRQIFLPKRAVDVAPAYFFIW